MIADPILSQKKMSSDDVPRRMVTLLLELLKSDELADDNGLLIGGAAYCVDLCLLGRPSLGPTALACGIFEIAVAQLKVLGSPADWVCLSRGQAGRAGRVMYSVNNVFKSFAGQAARPDVAACVSSGLFDMAAEAAAAFAAASVEEACKECCGVRYCHVLTEKVYTTPMFEIMASMGIFAFLWAIRKKIEYIPGLLFFIYLIFNGAERYWIEQYRVNDPYEVFGVLLTQAQQIAIVLILIGIVGSILRWNSRKKVA